VAKATAHAAAEAAAKTFAKFTAAHSRRGASAPISLMEMHAFLLLRILA
jgi:hypothetical protein